MLQNENTFEDTRKLQNETKGPWNTYFLTIYLDFCSTIT